MKAEKRKRLEKAGWRVGSVREFLGLTPEENAEIELRLTLVDAIPVLRKSAGLTQSDLARRIGSSQSRVARIEGGDPEVSIDLLIRAFLHLSTLSQLGRVISGIGRSGRRVVRPARAARSETGQRDGQTTSLKRSALANRVATRPSRTRRKRPAVRARK
jgi:transcriptional regulator with XRE-family HTH domain